MTKNKITKGFYDCYWPYEGSQTAFIMMLGDDCEDYMAKSAVKWAHKRVPAGADRHCRQGERGNK